MRLPSILLLHPSQSLPPSTSQSKKVAPKEKKDAAVHGRNKIPFGEYVPAPTTVVFNSPPSLQRTTVLSKSTRSRPGPLHFSAGVISMQTSRSLRSIRHIGN
ncbi:unnamed protein product [Microthlaspi erraticum]|uniref:Uncharacterized protein n=1 Tax=Microthlaspi erraticum TaxID=1685480 RepID=A0A6D2JM39_9BRAS|nr:unnamed protein product [Microthlaspi erraticum]